MNVLQLLITSILFICLFLNNSMSGEFGIASGYTISNASYKVELIKMDEISESVSGKHQILLKINNILSKNVKSMNVVFPEETQGVGDLYLSVAGHLLIKYYDQYFCYFQIRDIESGKVIDEIIVSDYSFSPSGKYMVYETSFEKMALPENKKTTFLLYDFARADDLKPINGDVDEPIQAIGWPLYPEEFAITHNFNMSPQNLIFSPTLWSKDETKIYFCAFEESDQKNYLVEVDISEGNEKPIINKKSLHDEDIFILENRVDYKIKEYEIHPFIFEPETLQWMNEDTILIQPKDKNKWIKSEILIHVPIKTE